MSRVYPPRFDLLPSATLVPCTLSAGQPVAHNGTECPAALHHRTVWATALQARVWCIICSCWTRQGPRGSA